MVQLSEAFLELHSSLMEQLGVKPGEMKLEDLSKELEKNLKRNVDITINFFTKNPDGTKKYGITDGHNKEVIESLRRQYGDSMSEREYRAIEKLYAQCRFYKEAISSHENIIKGYSILLAQQFRGLRQR